MWKSVRPGSLMNRKQLTITLGLFFVVSVYALVAWRFRQNPLLTWDLIGHSFAVHFQQASPLLGIGSWNPYFYLGTAHNAFYPPLFHTLAALIASFTTPAAALKILTGVAFIATPLSAYWMLRQYRLTPGRALFVTLAVTSVFFFTRWNGGDAISTFVIGNVTEALGLPLLLLYLGNLRRTRGTRRYRLNGVLLALIIVTNVVIAAMAALCTAIEAAVALTERRFRTHLAHWCLAFLLAGCFLVPALNARSWLASIALVDVNPLRYIEIFFLLVVTGLLGWLLKKEPETRPFVMVFLALLIIRFLIPDLARPPFQFYRLHFFLFFLATLLAGWIVLGLSDRWTRGARRVPARAIRLLTIGLPSFALGAFVLTRAATIGVAGTGPLPELPDLPQNPGRVFVVNSPGDTYSQHGLQHLVALQAQRFTNKGLFVESAANGRYLLDLEQALVGTESPAFVRAWGIRWDFEAIMLGALSETRFAFLRLFGFDAILTSDRLDPVVDATANERRILPKGLLWYRFPDAPLVEVITKPIEPVPERWDERVVDWYLTTDLSSYLVKGSAALEPGTGGETIDLLQVAPRQDDLRFRVNSERAVPVLVKISHFPNWRATINGRSAPVYRMSPNLILLYGSGDVHLWYGRSAAQYGGLGLTLAGLVWLIVGGLRQRQNQQSTIPAPR